MIDWNRVATLRDEVGAEDFEEVVDLFLEEVDGVTSRLQVNPDGGTLGADMHFLKGSAASLGFSAFTDLCQRGETLCAEDRAAEVDLPAILAAYADSKRLFVEGLPKAFAS